MNLQAAPSSRSNGLVRFVPSGTVLAWAFWPTPVQAQDAAAIAKAPQDPLASIAALMTDNAINFNTGQPEETTGYNLQFQPVYSVPFRTFNFVPRAVIPIIGAPSGANWPNLGQPTAGSGTDLGARRHHPADVLQPQERGRMEVGDRPAILAQDEDRLSAFAGLTQFTNVA